MNPFSCTLCSEFLFNPISNKVHGSARVASCGHCYHADCARLMGCNNPWSCLRCNRLIIWKSFNRFFGPEYEEPIFYHIYNRVDVEENNVRTLSVVNAKLVIKAAPNGISGSQQVVILEFYSELLN